MQGDFQHLHQVKIAGKDIGLCAKGPALHTTRCTAITGIFNLLSLADQFLDNGICIENGRLAETGFHDLHGPVYKASGFFTAHLHHG